eukprot:34799-Eustigmatos_ZCMA.PRE.1
MSALTNGGSSAPCLYPTYEKSIMRSPLSRCLYSRPPSASRRTQWLYGVWTLSTSSWSMSSKS